MSEPSSSSPAVPSDDSAPQGLPELVTGAHSIADGRLPRSFFVDPSNTCTRDMPLRDLMACRGRAGTLWVDIDTTSRQQVALLEKVFNFHPLAIEDVLNPISRPKVESYDGYLFVVIRVVRFMDETSDPYDLETENLAVFIGANYVVTAHLGRLPSVDAVADLAARSNDIVGRGSARLAHQIMDQAVDAFFPILERIDEFLDSLEERVFSSFDEEALRDIFAVKRLVLSLRRHLSPQREIFNILSNRPSSLLSPDVQLYFRDVYDHMLRINDSLDTYRDLMSSTMESYLSQISNRLNNVTKGLAVVATLSVPFVVVSGMWGMNFSRIPLADHRWGFEIMLVLQLAIGIGLAVLLRVKKMI